MRFQQAKGVRVGAAALVFAVIVGGLPAVSRAMPPSGGQAKPEAGSPAAKAADRLSLKEAGREFLSDAGRIWSSPARVRSKDLLPLIGLAAGTAVLIVADEPVRDHVQSYSSRHPWVGDVSSVVTKMGGAGGVAAAAAFFGAGLAFKDARARDTGYLAASALLQSFLIETLAKGLTGRQRPFVADGEDHWAGPVGLVKMFDKGVAGRYTSFPSGHTTAAFSLATVVAMQYRRTGWVPVVAYTIAGGVGLSRIGLDKHWASDVFVGAVLGHLVGRFVVRNHERRRRLVPMAGCVARGFAVRIVYDLDPDVGPDRPESP
jgi:membrane-associated phospholipid phosphatase